ncbi:MFS transporter [Blastopirellula sp. JC732]|uniref:MFS transporter n=1 Tax=Blastopirellula sediminis TaxID=2894196 RepID=A0A9X1SHL6_9BACT|nr:MFS transporter [Blastopirellula sediminis]MCC9605370.1 MFS transporter [Blastopirellula sediminis]MCC9631330.1 MFS transporter [Blastopirellula sediminis]
MSSLAADKQNSPAETPPSALSAEPDDGSETRNFFLLAFSQVVLRCGWIFKTESIIIPAVLDLIAGPGWIRGLLPILNRIGQSLPPLFYARTLKSMPQKKWSLCGTTLAMGICFSTLALCFVPPVRDAINGWYPDSAVWPSAWLTVAFLVCYFFFFAATGLNQVGFGTVQGKLVRVTKRGRLMLVANFVGAIAAIGLAAWLLPKWLSNDDAQVHWIFGFAGGAFLLSAGISALLKERHDKAPHVKGTAVELFHDAFSVLSEDRNFRRLAVVAFCFGCSLMLFPHYQALARERLGAPLENLILWVIIQNGGTAAFSLLGGPIADWKGNRLVLKLMMCGVFLMPLIAVVLIHTGPSGAMLFNWLFLLVGVTPVMFRGLSNYVLEISPRSEHPRYLAALSLCVAAPMIASPAVGWALDAISYEAVFLTISAILFGGLLMTWTIAEPRHT